MIERLAIDSVQFGRRQGSHTGALMNGSEDLIARARAGDQEAFRLIFERYSRPILAFIYDLVSQRDLAEELTQETFVRAYHHLNDLRDDAKFSTWLFGIGRNVAREALRSRLRDMRSLSDEGDSLAQNEKTMEAAPDDQLFGKELDAVMQHALQALGEDKRVVFALNAFHQCSYQEIAQITGFSLAKVKTDLHRARIEMRRRIRPFVEMR